MSKKRSLCFFFFFYLLDHLLAPCENFTQLAAATHANILEALPKLVGCVRVVAKTRLVEQNSACFREQLKMFIGDKKLARRHLTKQRYIAVIVAKRFRLLDFAFAAYKTLSANERGRTSTFLRF